MSTYETIKLDDYIQTGEGDTAQAYTRKDGKTLAKLYNPGFEADRAAAEFFTARILSEEPERLEEISLTFARFARELHTHKADTARLRAISEGTGFMDIRTSKEKADKIVAQLLNANPAIEVKHANYL